MEGKKQVSLWIDKTVYEELKQSCKDRNKIAGKQRVTIKNEIEKAVISRLNTLRRK